MKTLFQRLKHWPSTLIAVLIIALIAWLHFSGRVLVSEWEEFLTGLEALAAIVAARLLWWQPKPQGFTAPPDEEEPADPGATPFPNPTTPRPPKK